MKWKNELVRHVTEELRRDPQWQEIIEKALADPTRKIHLAIFNEPFLSLIYKGEKTVESRFSVNQISPYKKISKGDIVILKQSGGPITGVFLVGEVHFFSNLTKTIYKDLEEKYGSKIGTQYDHNFWVNRSSKRYCTLMEIKKIKSLIPFTIQKNDRLAWSVL